ncbi:hypothetical protein H9660_04395 [Clostridium sp. Sa3CUN1]|uniref:Integral membrane protein n=1 Tax=Clostridium gallinarum TaxID=2762246 RepID=A0ABR8Q1V8_9CLOT|nr:DUF6198 family protein [Clostridium gallinarum]MBD7914377.1 hypothetical protein [Clostridium gallinarum]
MKNLNRIIFYIIGLFLLALGSVLAIKSKLGVSPISSIPFSLTKVSNISLGVASTILFIFYVIIQMIILKRDFKKIQLLQIIFAVVFGQLVNFFNIIININLENYFMRVILVILSFFITAMGVFLTITSNIVPVAPDGLTKVISTKVNKEFGKVKIYFDCVVVSLAVLILLFSGKNLDGIGIGTVLSAILVGRIVLIINKMFKEKVENIIFL